LVFALTFGWVTSSIDFSAAFVQATREEPVWIHLPRGFQSAKGPNTCLRLVKSLYGLSVAPHLWVEHVKTNFLVMGLKQSDHDYCLYYRPGLLVGQYSDDICIIAKDKPTLQKFLTDLKGRGLEFTEDPGGLCEYLGIKLERDLEKGTFKLTQTGLIDKIVNATSLQACSHNRMPTTQIGLGADPDGDPMTKWWSNPSIIGMLLYLSTNTRPDIAYAVSQAACFNSNPKQVHTTAIKKIIRYLQRT
jgi:hypothetical protein